MFLPPSSRHLAFLSPSSHPILPHPLPFFLVKILQCNKKAINLVFPVILHKVAIAVYICLGMYHVSNKYNEWMDNFGNKIISQGWPSDPFPSHPRHSMCGSQAISTHLSTKYQLPRSRWPLASVECFQPYFKAAESVWVIQFSQHPIQTEQRLQMLLVNLHF